MRKFFAMLVLLLIFMVPMTAFAEVTPFDESKAEATTVMLFDAETGQEIYSKNPDEKVYPASTTKLLSVLVAIESGKMDENVKVGVEVTAFTEESSLMGLKAGETIPGKDLLYGMLLASGNDAAAATAVHVSGSEAAFVAAMNAKAKELGMDHSNFMNPHGVQNEQHYTTGADMKKLALAVYQNSEIMQILGTKTYTVKPTDQVSEPRELKHTNKLIYTSKPEDSDFYYQYATGMKSGYTTTSNGCLVASATKDNLSLIALIFDEPSEMGVKRWNMAKELFEYGFNNYQKVSTSDFIHNYSITETITNPAENDPEAGVLKLIAQPGDETSILLDIDQAKEIKEGTLEIEKKVNITRNLTAPVSIGEEFGEVEFLMGGTSLGTAKLVSSRDVYMLGDEKAQSEALGESAIEYWSKADVLNEIGKNKAVLWWLLIPAAVIVLLLVRTMMVNKRKIRSRRMPAVKYYRPARRKSHYRGRFR